MYREKNRRYEMEFLPLSAKRGTGEICLDIASWKYSCFASLSFPDFAFGIFFLKENGRTFGTAYRKYEPNQSGAS